MESSSSRPDANACYASASGPLAACEGALSAHSFAIPCNQDFHFYNSFDPFRCYSNQIFSNSQSLLSHLSVADRQPHPPEDLDDAFSWLVDYNDKLLELFSSSLECFDEERSRLERGFRRESTVEDERFELVTHGKANGGKKKQRAGSGEEGRTASHLAARVMVRDKKTGEWSARVPFHIPGIARPQDQFNILVNNTNQPFDHVWLDTTDDGTRFMHPLEKISVLDFVDGTVAKHEPVKSQSLQDTPIKLVDGVNELKELAMKLRNVTEFAVDLEHNQYRSFLGLTCLMQISTRMEDFVVDTLKLRIHIGPYLREIFKDPSKKKIMHGADRDILWLQRDFGIYICNLFDTGQASRILKLERHSLEYLLHHYCGVTLNKEYQNADWRLRPIPDEMIKYAREDTHYLLYLYDLMRHDLLASTYAENGGALIEAYKRSYDVCMQLYEKELLTDTSYLHIYGLREADFNCEQLAAAAALYEWRDGVARAEDESTGFILPNKALLEVARQLPRTRGKLRQLVGSRHPFVERQLDLVVSIIKCAVINAPAFAGVLQQLEEERFEAESKKLDAGSNETNSETSRLGDAAFLNTEEKVQSLPDSSGDGMTTDVNTASVQALKKPSGAFGALLGSSSSRQRPDLSSSKSPELDNTASVQALKKPSGAFGALLCSSSSRQRPDASSSKSSEREVAQIKLEQIKSSVHLPLFSIPDVTVERPKECLESPQYQHAEQESDVQPDAAVYEEIIPLGGESDDSHQSMEIPESCNSPKDSTTHKMDNLERTKTIEPASDTDGKVGSPSLAELSSGLEKCFNSLSQSAEKIKPWRPQGPLKVEPYDYAAAKKRFNSGGNRDAEEGSSHKSSRGGRRERKAPARGPSEETSETGFQAARRRQAFPPSGNRNATFR